MGLLTVPIDRVFARFEDDPDLVVSWIVKDKLLSAKVVEERRSIMTPTIHAARIADEKTYITFATYYGLDNVYFGYVPEPPAPLIRGPGIIGGPEVTPTPLEPGQIEVF